MSNLSSKGFRSTTFAMCSVTGAASAVLLVAGYIDQSTFKSLVEMAIGGYVVRHASNVAAESYRDKGKV